MQGPSLYANGAVSVHTLAGLDASKADRRARANAWTRELLADVLGVSSDELELVTGEHGKPLLAGGSLHFNLSHSGEFALLAISRSVPVGIDVQKLRELRDEGWWRRRLCSQRELREQPQGAELLRLWARKEAVVKATGEGLLRELTSVDVSRPHVDGVWCCIDLPAPAPGYVAALSYRDVSAVTDCG